MTKPVILVPLSVIVPCDPAKTKQAFAELGVSSWQFFRHWFTWNKLIVNYRLGKMTHAFFRDELKKVFPVLKACTDENFDKAWNKMCEYSEQSTASFKAIQELVDAGYRVYVYARTNPKHIEYITQKFREASGNTNAVLPGRTYWSYEGEGQKIQHDYVANLRARIKAWDSTAIIQHHYTQPTDPAPGWVGWFKKPYEKFAFRLAQIHVNNLHKRASEMGFTLVQCDEHHTLASKLLALNLGESKQEETIKLVPFCGPSVTFRRKTAVTVLPETSIDKVKADADADADLYSTLEARAKNECRVS